MECAVTTLPFPQAQAKPRGDSPVYRFGKNHANWNANTNGVNSRVPGALFGDMDPERFLKHEKPVHRVVTNMVLQGYTLKEAAEATGLGAATVRRACRQPYARQRMIETAKKDVSLEIKQFLEAEVLPSLRVLSTVRDDPNARASDRLAAANALLDRHLGRPTQPFTLPAAGKDPSKMTDAELDAALRSTGFDPANAAAAVAASRQAETTSQVESA